MTKSTKNRKRSHSRNHKSSSNHSQVGGGAAAAAEPGVNDVSSMDDNQPQSQEGEQCAVENTAVECLSVFSAEPTATTSTTNTQSNSSLMLRLQWDSPSDFIPLEQEEAMVQMILERYGKNERGMLKDKPPHVVKKFKRKMHQVAPSMSIRQLASLRRHHIKRLNFYRSSPELRLGNVQDINEAARIFETVIGTWLDSKHIPYWSEEEQHERAAKENRRVIGTPDFLLKQPVLFQKTRRTDSSNNNINNNKNNNTNRRNANTNGPNHHHQQQQRQRHQQSVTAIDTDTSSLMVLEERTIHWIEVKMFYGASTIPHERKGGAVGTILEKVQKYVELFGDGVIVFMNGCGDRLAHELNNANVSVVDCSSSNEFDLRPVYNHQRTWCANEHGEILP